MFAICMYNDSTVKSDVRAKPLNNDNLFRRAFVATIEYWEVATCEGGNLVKTNRLA